MILFQSSNIWVPTVPHYLHRNEAITPLVEIFYELTVEGRWNLTLVREKSGLSESNDDWIPEGLLGGSSDHMFVRTRTRTQFLASSLFLAAAVLSHFQLSTPENNYFIIKINFRERERDRQTDRQTFARR